MQCILYKYAETTRLEASRLFYFYAKKIMCIYIFTLEQIFMVYLSTHTTSYTIWTMSKNRVTFLLCVVYRTLASVLVSPLLPL